MSEVRVLVVRAAGINCDEETLHCWRIAGARPVLEHVNAIASRPAMLEEFDIVTVPGGFSYGDDISAGTILAHRLMDDLADGLRRLVDRGGGVLGICNGLQVLVKMGLLPGGEFGRDAVTVTYNDSARFEARWVKLKVCTDRCPFLGGASDGARLIELPVEHAEGRVVTADDTTAAALERAGQRALRYVDDAGRTDVYPANPNGSHGGIAGLCDPTGRVFGLMPHPDRFFDRSHHPCWTRRDPAARVDGLEVFRSAVAAWGKKRAQV